MDISGIRSQSISEEKITVSLSLKNDQLQGLLSKIDTGETSGKKIRPNQVTGKKRRQVGQNGTAQKKCTPRTLFN